MPSPGISAVIGVELGIMLRLPWLHAPLGHDEGGVTMIARAWEHSHPFPYGAYFLDRPPLLVLLYGLADDIGGTTGIRILGMVAASAAVVICTLLSARVAGRAAALPAALLAAVLTSSAVAQSVYTPAELLAIVPSSASVLLLLAGLRREHGIGWELPAAGAAAIAALLIKQSFADALVAGAIGVLVAGWRIPWRRTAARAGAYAGGAACTAVAVLLWQVAGDTSGQAPDSVSYALFGFRVDAVNAVASSNVAHHLSTFAAAALGSGVLFAAVVAVAGIVTLRARHVTAAVLGAWMLAGLLGVLGGGGYSAHYLIEIVPVASVGVAALVARHRLATGLACAAVVSVGTVTSVVNVAMGRPATNQRSAVVLGDYLRARAAPGDTAYVLYAEVNALFYSGLPSPFPYHWSLMMTSVPGAEQQLRALLASPRRPTWVIEAQTPRSYGLDRSGETTRLLAREYRRVATVCGKPVLLARGAGSRPQPTLPQGCAMPAGRLDFDV